MSDALLAGVSGLQAHQTMLDVAGNNLANINTLSFKSARVRFGELLAQTLREATPPAGVIGGTNPQQIGSGVRVASVDHNMQQGNLIYTGQPLDMAIEGGGYFTLNDGQKNVYSRVGAFTVDAAYYLVDPNSGYRVQRVGSEGVAEGFQDPSAQDIRVPYDIPLPAKATKSISFNGNLQGSSSNPTTAFLTSDMQYTVEQAAASTDTLLTDLDQASNLAVGDTISITGKTKAGTAVNATFTLAANSTINNLVSAISVAFPGSTASFYSGEISLSDDTPGYSQTDINLAYNGAGSFTLPNYFNLSQAGGEETRTTNIEVFDSQGASHDMVISFVRTNQPNTWDAVLASISGDVTLNDRRVNGITFGSDGTYAGLGGAMPDVSSFSVTYACDASNERELRLNLGSIGQVDGLTQFGQGMTATANGQDGYEAGYLASLSVSSDGVLVGMFTNGIRKNIAALKMATFLNPAGLQNTGGGFFSASANSGDPVYTKALAAGAGSVTGGSLEKSNVDMASEFVNLIQAQNGYQANARTISVANNMLQQLANVIR
jgi:flagellar hook protein FlgE